jgi:hypothetical protein
MAQSSRTSKKASTKLLRAADIWSKLDTQFAKVGAEVPSFDKPDNHTPLLWDYLKFHRLRKWSEDYLKAAKDNCLQEGLIFDHKAPDFEGYMPGNYTIHQGVIGIDLLVKNPGKPSVDRDKLISALRKTKLSTKQISDVLEECSKERGSAYEFTPKLNLL